MIKGWGFHQLTYRKGLGKLSFRYLKYLEQTHLTVDSSTYFRFFFSREKFGKSRSVGIRKRYNFVW